MDVEMLIFFLFQAEVLFKNVKEMVLEGADE